MSVIVKNLVGGTRTASYMEDGELKKWAFESGRSRISDELWAKIKDTRFIKNKLAKDELTVSYQQEIEEVLDPIEGLDVEKLEGFIGQDDAKELIAEYAKEFGIVLEVDGRRKSSTMVNQFKEEYAKLSKED